MTTLPLSARPGAVGAWVLAARPKTLSAAVVPVVVGTAVAHATGGVRVGPALAALLGAVLLQIAANFANDVFDYEKGADTDERLGPTRAVASGLIPPARMRAALGLSLAAAFAIGIYLTAVAGPAIVIIGLLSMASAVAYTGGPYPLGYNGLGDVFVLVFFGFVAVGGTAFVQLGRVPAEALIAALPVGALATAILVVNNIRDVDTDVKAGKRTLAVRFGRGFAVAEYAFLLVVSFTAPVVLLGRGFGALVLLPLATLPLAVFLFDRVRTERGTVLNTRLAMTAALLLGFGVLLSAGIALGRP
ncbi:MAG: 1,4-dihydroxy-2-naphthoate polyprenyltransferase [Polyangiaceae bacterium]|nr:1,4-dihydroxy-2-naphthoate polyprenyltransferase [Polyangiaceae bacterium]